MRGRNSRRRHSLIPIALTALFLAVALNVHSSAPDRQFVRAKNSPVISDWATTVIGQNAKDGRVRVWVYFTDKGFFDERGMSATVSQKGVALPERAAARRVKMGRDRVMFLDIPVRDTYVDRVRDLGGMLRRESRWLNAASFEIEVEKLDSLSRLPFVAEIGPVIKYARVGESEVGLPEKPQSQDPVSAGIGSVLNYGASLSQLTQINVPAAHTAGYRGQGVRVCMMDTGYRKNHIAFAYAYSQNRVIAEYDFIFNDGNTQDSLPQDASGQHSHGTSTWSILGGALDGTHYGPAFESEFLLAKTEYVPTETQVEEDNWVAAMEWADQNGADVISSSLGYTDWYVAANYNGDFCVTTKAADSAAVLGIVVCNSAGNSGPGSSTLGAPADADSILTVGSVGSGGNISGFSSRGPTADSRIKPEVCALGEGNSRASSASTSSFSTSGNGTSYACPLVGGAAAIILSAHPTWTPMQVREALMMTASQFCTPNNNYGWGIIDVMAAINYDGCTEPGAPNAPSTTNDTPCASENYTIVWSPKTCATGYELYENDILIYAGALTQQTLARASGSFTYTVRATNGCGAGVASAAGGATVIQAGPAAPSAPLTSNSSPCASANYTVSWSAVSLATAYELYENDVLVFDGANLNTTRSHASGTFTYHVIAKNGCASGPQSADGAVTTINDCACHADAQCDGVTNIQDVVLVVNEAFRGSAPLIDSTCTHASRNDVDCDCTVSITDVVHVVNVAFRGANPAIEFCDACASQCP